MVLLHHFVINRGVVIGLRVHPRPLVHLRLTERKVLDRPAKLFLVRRGLRNQDCLRRTICRSSVRRTAWRRAIRTPPSRRRRHRCRCCWRWWRRRWSWWCGAQGSAPRAAAQTMSPAQAAQPDQTLMRLCKSREERERRGVLANSMAGMSELSALRCTSGPMPRRSDKPQRRRGERVLAFGFLYLRIGKAVVRCWPAAAPRALQSRRLPIRGGGGGRAGCSPRPATSPPARPNARRNTVKISGKSGQMRAVVRTCHGPVSDISSSSRSSSSSADDD
eukprot:COSAG04_NODE_5593_length_1556_cov_11.650652_1_plen_275_part_10